MNELIFTSATVLAQAILAREVSAQAVMEALLQRIAEVNPKLNAVVQLAPAARAQAQQADADLANGIVYGPLHGVPFTVKDVFATAGFASALDQKLRQRKAPTVDATVVARLRQAGAILLGKTNCPPNGSGNDTENMVTGRTFNPYNLAHTPGGSSGGEAALIAAGGSPFGLGSDANGGVRVPAHYCGVAALKPTFGRLPNTGAYNQPGGLTDPRTQIGLLARTVDDLALVLPLIIGPDDSDASVIPMPWRDPILVEVKTLRVAYFSADPASPVTRETDRVVGGASQALARAGIQVEAARPESLVHDSREIDELWQNMAGSNGRTNGEVVALWDHFRTRLLQFMAGYDAILCPVDHHPAPPFRERDPRRFDYTVPFSMTGYPCAVVRVGSAPDNAPNGLPIGVQLVARPWREDVALALARILEKAWGGWKRPLLGEHA